MKVTELFEARISAAAQQSFDNSSESWKAGYNDYKNKKGWNFPTARLKTKEGKQYRAGWDEAEKAALRKKKFAAERKAAKGKQPSDAADYYKPTKTAKDK